MKTMTKKTAVVALAGVMAAGMLTGCGEKALDGTKTVATVDGAEIPLKPFCQRGSGAGRGHVQELYGRI
mgnify:CR=1 FL=1